MTAEGAQALARFLERCRDDPVFFAKHMLGMDLHPGQVRWLQNANQPINVLVPGNRYGKSTVVAVSHLWRCFTKRGFKPFRKDQHWGNFPYSTISVSVSADQAEIVFGMARKMIQHPAMRPFIKRVYSTPFPTIVFVNGSRMTCRSAHDNGKYVDGHRFDYVSIDEAGYIDNLKHLVNSVILMRLAGGGQLDLLGTPKGISESGLYFYATRGLRGVDGYYCQRGSSYDNNFLPAEDIKKRDDLIRHADPRLREQILYGAFVSAEGLAFTPDQLEQAFVPGMPQHRDYVPGHRYVQAWDLGRKTDFTVGVTFDVSKAPFEMVDFTRLNRVPWETIYGLIRDRAKEYHVSVPRIDATGPQGDVVEEELAKRGVFVDAYRVSTGSLKLNLINTLQAALDYNRETLGMGELPDEAGVLQPVPILERPGEGNWGLIRMPPVTQLVDEFGIYQLDDKDLTQDCVQAVALAVHAVYDGMLLPEPVEGGLYG